MALLMNTDADRPAADDMSEEQMLRQLLEAQSQAD
jgi:DNA-directed RNA polymerase subunit omega